jgi:glyoxylase-like metal-dependent hydrolase (beta-lactamase superfamily II)
LYLIRAGATTLIDSGIVDTPGKFVLPYLHRLGLGSDALHNVLITHAHHDHFGGNGELFKANSAINFMASRLDFEWMEDHQRHFNEMYNSFPGEWDPDERYERAVLMQSGDCVPIQRAIQDGDEILLDHQTSLSCRAVPAHSRGHLMFVLEREQTCFVGDAIQGEGTRLESGISVFPLYEDVDEYLNSLGKIRRLNADWVCTGHFGVLNREAAEFRLRQSEETVAAHGDHVWDTLWKSGRPISLASLVRSVHEVYYPEYERAYQIHATTHAHLRQLQREGRAKRVPSDGKLLWTTV